MMRNGVTATLPPVICGECGHFFDPIDKRGYIAEAPDPRTSTPPRKR